MQFYQTRKRNSFENFYQTYFPSINTIEKSFFFQKLKKPFTKNSIKATTCIYFLGYFSILVTITVQGLNQSTGLISFLNNSSLRYQLKSLRKLRKQKRIFHKKKWIYGTNLPENYQISNNQLLITNKSWGHPKNYRKSTEFIKNKYVLIPAQQTHLENFIRYKLHSPQRYFSTQLITIHGKERFFGNEIVSIIYPPLHPRILRLYLKDKALALQTDKKTLIELELWGEKAFLSFFLSANNRFYFLAILNLWSLLCFCIFIQQVIEGFCFTLLNDGEEKSLGNGDPFSEYLLPSNLILPQYNTKNFFEGVQTGIATYELKTLVKNLQTQQKFSFQSWLTSFIFLEKKINTTINRKNLISSLPKGIIFVGNFDNGGIHFSQALAGEAKIPFVRIPATQFLLTNIHEGLLVMRIIFYYTKIIAPAILHIEDIDTFCGIRNSLDIVENAKKSSMFSVKYECTNFDSNKYKKDQRGQTFSQAFQRFKDQKIKTYNDFISVSLKQIFSYVNKLEKTNKFDSQTSNSGIEKSSMSEDDLTSLLNQLLIELDGLDSQTNQNSLLTTTTSRDLKTLEPALIRPGRLSKHIEFDSLYTLDREKIIKSLLFKHKYRTIIPWYLFANQLQNFQYISIKQIIEKALYHSQVFTQSKNLIELNSLLFAKKEHFSLLKQQNLLLVRLEESKINRLKRNFNNYTFTQLLLRNPEIDLTTIILAKESLRNMSSSNLKASISYFYQYFSESSTDITNKYPQTANQSLNSIFRLALLYILDNIWNQQQSIETPSLYHSLLYQYNLDIVKFHKQEFSKQLFYLNSNSLQNKLQDNIIAQKDNQANKQLSFQYLNSFAIFYNIDEPRKEFNQGMNFTETKTLNLIDVFGNMQFVSNWKQTSEISLSELEKVEPFIAILRNLFVEYHAYLSYLAFQSLCIDQKEKS